MKLLVTGGAGFIGSHIVEGALALGWQVAVLDNLSAGKRENVPSAAALHVVDICDAAAVHALVAEFRPDVISHQAAQASVSVSVREPIQDAQVNIMGTLNVLEAARAHGVQRVLFASTGGAIYGEVPEGTQAQISWPARPQSPYATSKRAIEYYLETYRVQYGLDYRILRYANVYGPRQDPHGEAGVVAIFSQRLLAGQPLRINARKVTGDAGCVRDYVYVSDVVRANLQAAQGSAPNMLNVGTGMPTTTLLLAEQIMAQLGITTELTYGEPRAGDVEYSVLDPSEYIAHMGTQVGLAEGLAQTVAWFKAKHA